jgi:hypothetical protein
VMGELAPGLQAGCGAELPLQLKWQQLAERFRRANGPEQDGPKASEWEGHF